MFNLPPFLVLMLVLSAAVLVGLLRAARMVESGPTHDRPLRPGGGHTPSRRGPRRSGDASSSTDRRAA